MFKKILVASAERRTCVCCAFSVLALLLGLGYEGLFVSLSEDDLMNLHFGMREPFVRLLIANLFPFTTVFRPAGSALYVALFKIFGSRPSITASFCMAFCCLAVSLCTAWSRS